MPRAHRLQLGDVGHDDVLGHDPKATVVHDGERTVPAAVRAPVAGLDGAGEPLFITED